MLVAVRQHREEARTLDRGGQLTLVDRTGAGQAGRGDLAVFADEITQDVEILVIDRFDTGDGEAAETLALEQQGLLVALDLAVLGKLTTWRGMTTS